MNTQIIIMLIAGVAIVRFFKSIFDNTKNTNTIAEEATDFMLHVIIVMAVYAVIYFGLSFFA